MRKVLKNSLGRFKTATWRFCVTILFFLLTFNLEKPKQNTGHKMNILSYTTDWRAQWLNIQANLKHKPTLWQRSHHFGFRITYLSIAISVTSSSHSFWESTTAETVEKASAIVAQTTSEFFLNMVTIRTWGSASTATWTRLSWRIQATMTCPWIRPDGWRLSEEFEGELIT